MVAVWCMMLTMAPAQQIKWGSLFKEKASVTVSDIVNTNSEGLVVMKAKYRLGFWSLAKDFKLQRFDSNFNTSLISEVEPTYEDKDLTIEWCFQSNGQIYLFTSFVNKKLDKVFLFHQKVNAKTLQLEGPIKKVSESSFERVRRLGGFSYSFSRDSSHVLLYANTESKKNEPDKYALHVLDADMNEVWNKEVTLPYTESKFAIEDFCVDNDGNVFMLGVKYQERGESKRRGTPNYEYKILGYRKDGTDVEEYSVSLGDMFLTDMKIDVSPKKDIVCAGFYSEKGTFSIKGTYYLRIDRKSKEIERISSKEFDIDFITMNFTPAQEKKAKKREAKGKNVELYEYDLRDLVPRGDGGAVLLAEQYYVTVVCRTDPKTGTTTCTYYYHYNDIIVVSVSPEGQIEWATKVSKRQTSANDGGYFSSFAHMISQDKLYFIFNDTKKNLEVEKQGKYYNFALGDKNGIVMLASVDAEGNVERRALMSNEEISAITRPKLCQQISPTEMILYAKRRKGSQFGLVTF
jgi:hypothetical protein